MKKLIIAAALIVSTTANAGQVRSVDCADGVEECYQQIANTCREFQIIDRIGNRGSLLVPGLPGNRLWFQVVYVCNN